MAEVPVIVLTVSATEYAKVKDALTGEVRVVAGPQFVFLGTHKGVLSHHSISVLKQNESMKIIDRSTGRIRVEVGPIIGTNIDEHTAVVVRNTRDGSLQLRTNQEVFFPSAEQEIVAIRKKILLELRWSSGLLKQEKSLVIQKIDSRPKFMWYEFEVRTKDNVELVLGITFFWQIIDVFLEKSGDIISGSILGTADRFYSVRGVEIHSVEVSTGWVRACQTPRSSARAMRVCISRPRTSTSASERTIERQYDHTQPPHA